MEEIASQFLIFSGFADEKSLVRPDFGSIITIEFLGGGCVNALIWCFAAFTREISTIKLRLIGDFILSNSIFSISSS